MGEPDDTKQKSKQVQMSRVYKGIWIDEHDGCEPGKKCHGYGLGGAYTIKTDKRGENQLTVDAYLKMPKFSPTLMIGVGWGIGLGPSQKTEAYLAQWSWQNDKMKHGWGTMSGITDMTIEEVAANPLKA